MAYFPKIGPFYDPDNEQEIYGDSHGRIQLRTFPQAKNEGGRCPSFLPEDKLRGKWTTYLNREHGEVYFLSLDNEKNCNTSADVIPEHQNGHRKREHFDFDTPRRPSMDSGLGYSPVCDYEIHERNGRHSGSGKRERPMPRIEEVTDFRRADCHEKQYCRSQWYSSVLPENNTEPSGRVEGVTDFRNCEVLDQELCNGQECYGSESNHRTFDSDGERIQNGSHSLSRDNQRYSGSCSGSLCQSAAKINQRHHREWSDKFYSETTQYLDSFLHNTPNEKSTHSCSSPTVSCRSVKNSQSVQRCKDVVLLPNYKHVCRGADSGVVLCEKLFGIILCQYNHKTGSSRMGDQNMTNVLKERKIIVQDVIPRSSAEKCGHIHRGDMLISLNDFEVNWLNIDKVFQTLTKREPVKLTFQSPVIVGPKPPLPPTSASKPSPPPPHQDFYKLVTGSDISRGQAAYEDVTYSLMYLTLAASSDQPKASRDDIIYMYPFYDTKLVDIRGLFLTLNSFLVEITDSRPRNSLVQIDEKQINIAYRCEDSDVLVIALPQDKMPFSCLNEFVEQIIRLLQVMFGGLNKAFKHCDRNQLDQLFALTFNQVFNCNQSTVDSEELHFRSVFLNTFMGISFLQLSEENKLICDEILSEFEAADFEEFMDEDELEDRRSFTILGCSLFYKDYQVCTHLRLEDSVDLVLFLKHHGLLTMMSQQSVTELVVWQELWPTQRCHQPDPGVLGYQQPAGRWFLLLVAMKHFLLGTLLEAGGCSRPDQDVDGPDEMMVDQAKATLLQLESDVDMADICEKRLSCNSGSVPLVRADLYLAKKSKKESLHSPLKSPDSPVLASTPLKSALESVVRSGLGSDKKPGFDDADSDKSGNVTVTDSSPVMLRKGSKLSYGSNDSVGSGSSTGAPKTKSSRRSLLSDMANIGRSVSALQIDEFVPDDRLVRPVRENCLFQYVKLYNMDGVVVMPSWQQTVHGAVQTQLLDNFYRCSIQIRKTFRENTPRKDKSFNPDRFGIPASLGILQEQGILFKCCPPPSGDSKKSPPSLCYWVVGRRFCDDSEMYVCFHESSPQSVVELAFNFSFGTEF